MSPSEAPSLAPGQMKPVTASAFLIERRKLCHAWRLEDAEVGYSRSRVQH